MKKLLTMLTITTLTVVPSVSLVSCSGLFGESNTGQNKPELPNYPIVDYKDNLIKLRVDTSTKEKATAVSENYKKAYKSYKKMAEDIQKDIDDLPTGSATELKLLKMMLQETIIRQQWYEVIYLNADLQLWRWEKDLEKDTDISTIVDKELLITYEALVGKYNGAVGLWDSIYTKYRAEILTPENYPDKLELTMEKYAWEQVLYSFTHHWKVNDKDASPVQKFVQLQQILKDRLEEVE